MPDPAKDKLGKFRLTAVADTPDLRDWVYEPALVQLKREVDPPDNLNILNQGGEGSCTGFALATVINLLRHRGHRRGFVSPRMLYEMAKQQDEWPGFDYEGSNCRGAIKGWYNMGVCLESKWKYEENKPGHLTVEAAKDARNNTLGAYYRIGNRISDFHAALNEVGVVYCSAIVHEGWQRPSKKYGVIPMRDEPAGGHAFAIIGYDERGFWVQNSWGSSWGLRGRALWTYEDWQRNVTDAWVLRLALPTPQVWHLASEGGSDASRAEGLFKKTPTRAEIAGHFVHIDDVDKRAGGLADWSDRLIERMTHRPGRSIWREMKYGAEAPFKSGGDGLAVVEEFLKAIASSKKSLKLHLVGHSTGAILHAYLTAALKKLERKVRITSASLLAPAATVKLFKSNYRPSPKAPKSETGINHMDIYNLSDKLELDDTVIGIYRKSLLYPVSRSFEEDERPAAILDMEKYKRGVATGLNNLTIHYSYGDVNSSKDTKSETHGGFDNDQTTMNNVLKRVLGKKPMCPFTEKSLKY